MTTIYEAMGMEADEAIEAVDSLARRISNLNAAKGLSPASIAIEIMHTGTMQEKMILMAKGALSLIEEIERSLASADDKEMIN